MRTEENNKQDNKIAFIICSNSDLWLQECNQYLQMLIVPEGFEVEVLSIHEAKSMAAGYNEGMTMSDAKYKIYMHHDVFVLNKYLLCDILDIFNSDDEIGIIGIVGARKLASDAMMWHEQREGSLYAFSNVEIPYNSYRYTLSDGYEEMSVVDGLMIATSKDVMWRDDVFDGWDFYDVSQSFEFRKAGYKVVVPNQKSPWVYHDDGMMNLWNYNEYRKKVIEIYKEMFSL